VFAYVLSHRGGNSFSQQWPGMAEPWGVCHGDDLYYLFSPLYHAEHNLTEADLEVRELMLQAWSSFARTGDPSPPGGSLEWQPLVAGQSGTQPWYLNITGSDSIMAASQDVAARIEMWESLKQLDTRTPHSLRGLLNYFLSWIVEE